MSSIGARLPRIEDQRLLRGRGRFGDDISAPGQLWARVVRSPSAHGDINDVDVTLAAKAPGIAAVVSAADLTTEQARELVASNLCRCTGYQGIVEAVVATARTRRAQKEAT